MIFAHHEMRQKFQDVLSYTRSIVSAIHKSHLFHFEQLQLFQLKMLKVGLDIRQSNKINQVQQKVNSLRLMSVNKKVEVA
jgi:hypothetical protein